MNKLLAILLLPPVAAIKIILIPIGLVVVWVKMIYLQRDMEHGLYQIEKGRPFTYWEAAIRNPVGGFNFLIKHPDNYDTYGKVYEPRLTTDRFQWRFNHYKLLCSLRLVWKYSGTRYGELYLGWKLGSAPPELDFALSLRPWATVGN